MMYNYIFSVTTFQWAPSQSYVTNGCSSPDCFTGYFADLFYAVQSELNFTFTIRDEGPREQIGIIFFMIFLSYCC